MALTASGAVKAYVGRGVKLPGVGAANRVGFRIVVKLAKKRGRKVVVGGHSLGGSITTAYATWDFDGVAAWGEDQDVWHPGKWRRFVLDHRRGA